MGIVQQRRQRSRNDDSVSLICISLTDPMCGRELEPLGPELAQSELAPVFLRLALEA